MTISVASKDAESWIANIYYVYDKDHSFYWYSPKDSKHSKIIRENLSIAVFDSTAVGDDVDAVYIKARSHEISDRAELIKGLTFYTQKMIKTKFANMEIASRILKQTGDFEGTSKIRMYKAVPEKIYKLAPSEVYNDKFIDSRIKVDLN